MSFSQTVSTLRQLYVSGGLEVVTPEKSGSSESRIRTVVQPDADIITFVTRAAFEDPKDIENHAVRVASKINSVAVARRVLRGLWVLELIPALWILGGLARGSAQHLVTGIAVSILPLVVRPKVIRLVGRRLGRARLRQYFGSFTL